MRYEGEFAHPGALVHSGVEPEICALSAPSTFTSKAVAKAAKNGVCLPWSNRQLNVTASPPPQPVPVPVPVPTASQNSPQSAMSGLALPQVIGIVVGSLAAIIVIGLAVYFGVRFVRQRRLEANERAQSPRLLHPDDQELD